MPALFQRLPSKGAPADSDTLLTGFLEYVTEKKLELYLAQEEAILELFEDKNCILNTPTGSGKSLVAAAMHFKSLARGRRSVYTCPVKALVNEKFLALCRDFGADNVGMATGDATVNRDAPILCCTAEILANFGLRHGSKARIDDIIMDEFHYYSDRDRGVAWQVPLLTLPQARFLLMSATLGDTSLFETELTSLTHAETVVVRSVQRPVPLEFQYSEEPLEHTVENLVQEGKAPVYVVHFSQLECPQNAQHFTSINVCSREEKQRITDQLQGVQFSSPYGKDIRKFLGQGIGLHHAGLLPKYRVLVEQLAQKGLLKIICGTDTLGVGVNVPIRTVLFTRLCKYDGEKTAILSARDFHQIAGRAGRKGFDHIGYVVAQAPEHVVENIKQERKAAGDPKKLKKLVKKKPPEKGFVNWDEKTFQRLIQAPPEPLTSRFQMNHGILLNVLSREYEDGCRAIQRIIRHCHESPNAKKQLRQRGWQLFRSLLDRNIVEIPEEGSPIRINVELQEDFSLHQTLSLYLIDALPQLDAESPLYAHDLLSLVESILEDPDLILRKQLDKRKGEMVAEMKQQGIDYEERMLKLEELEHPKPLRDFIYSTFNEFAAQHPWVGQENIRPKSIAREMYENFQTFADYIRAYDLHRMEGVLLRHMSGVYKVLVQTVPDSYKSEPVQEMITFFGAMVRQVDSSLLDEWERLRDPNWVPQAVKEPEPKQPVKPIDITRNEGEFLMLVRAQVFDFLRALAASNTTTAIEILDDTTDDSGNPWTEPRLQEVLEAYHRDHERIRLDAEARNSKHTYVEKKQSPAHWMVHQTLVDLEENNDWSADFRVDLNKSRDEGKPHLQLLCLGELGN